MSNNDFAIFFIVNITYFTTNILCCLRKFLLVSTWSALVFKAFVVSLFYLSLVLLFDLHLNSLKFEFNFCSRGVALGQRFGSCPIQHMNTTLGQTFWQVNQTCCISSPLVCPLVVITVRKAIRTS